MVGLQLIEAGGLGVNIVAVVRRVEGDRVWIKSNGAGMLALAGLRRRMGSPWKMQSLTSRLKSISTRMTGTPTSVAPKLRMRRTNAKSRLPITPLPLNSTREAARKFKQLPRVPHYMTDQNRGEGQYEEKITVLSGSGR